MPEQTTDNRWRAYAGQGRPDRFENMVDSKGTQESFPEKAQKVLDTLYEAVGARDKLQRLEYLRKLQQAHVSVETDDDELKMREFYYLTKIGVLED